MALKIGNNAVTGAYLGANQVRRAYKGGTLVYQGFSPASEQEFIQQTAAGGPAQLLKVYGKSVVNNQLVDTPHLTGTSTASWQEIPFTHFPVTTSHKYAILLANWTNLSIRVRYPYISGTITANSIITPTADGNLGLQYIGPADSHGAVDTYVYIIDLTLRFGAGNEPTSVDEALRLLGGDAFDPAYDAGSLQSNKTAELRAYDGGTLRGSLALNLSTLTSGGVVVFPDGLRGVGTDRDAAYGSTGEVVLAAVDLGDLTYGMTSGAFYATVSGRALGKLNIKCPLFTAVNTTVSNLADGQMMGATDSARVYFKNSVYADAAAFKAAMQGVMLVYALATPLTYTLDTPLPTDLTCEQGDILQRVSDNNCPFVGEMKFGL